MSFTESGGENQNSFHNTTSIFPPATSASLLANGFGV
jgi:hypothetical protein